MNHYFNQSPLKVRWLNLMHGLRLPKSEECFTNFLKAYNEPHRYYHNGLYVQAMLNHFDQVEAQCSHPKEVELAIWFHDAIYDPQSHLNEANSADWVYRFLTSVNYNTDGIARVHQLIMSTAYRGQPQTPDEELLVDIDLTILGADE